MSLLKYVGVFVFMCVSEKDREREERSDKACTIKSEDKSVITSKRSDLGIEINEFFKCVLLFQMLISSVFMMVL